MKLLDFGIAKLLDADETLTRTGRPLLTPAYAAPEQQAGGAITTATDVYGLGVLLYELLVGRRPDAADPTRPSDAVTTSATGRVPPEPGAPAPEASGARGVDTGALRATTPERLRRRLRGDLDRIVLKALRADPERRYRGAAELGADIGRHLGGLPIEARPESVVYRAGKFVRRNRVLVAAAVVALASVVAGAATTVVQSQRVLHEQRVNAAVSGYMQSIFRGAGGERADSSLTVAEVTARGARRVETDLAGQPEARAEAYRLIAEIYLSVGRAEAADSAAARSVELWEGQGLGRSPEAARSRTVRGLALSRRGDEEEAERVLGRAREDLLALGASPRDDVADTQARLAGALADRGRAAAAVPLLRRVLGTRKTVHGSRSAEALRAQEALASVLQQSGAE